MALCRIFPMVVLLTSLAACGVSESDYQRVVSERDDLEERLRTVQRESDALKEKTSALQAENKALGDQMEKLKSELARPQREPQPKTAAKKETPETKPTPRRGASAARGRTYEVKKGDNLWAISRQTGVSVDTLRKLNSLEPKQLLRVGQKLKLEP